MSGEISDLRSEIQGLKAMVAELLARQADPRPPEVYTPEEFAKAADVTPYTVREWCRLGRIHASKVAIQHGAHREWRITHEEFLRWRREGLLPLRAGLASQQPVDSAAGQRLHRAGMVGRK